MLIPAFPLNFIQVSTAASCISNFWCVAFRLCQVISTFHHVTCISLLNSLFWAYWLTHCLDTLKLLVWCVFYYFIKFTLVSPNGTCFTFVSFMTGIPLHFSSSWLACVSFLSSSLLVFSSWFLLGFHSRSITPPELLVMSDPSSGHFWHKLWWLSVLGVMRGLCRPGDITLAPCPAQLLCQYVWFLK